MSKKKKKDTLTRAERVCRTLLILMMTAAALWGVWKILVPKPTVPDGAPVPPTATTRPSTGQTAGAGDASAEADEGPNRYERKEDFWTFLFVGMDASGGNTDTLMLVSYDVKNQTVAVSSIARDTRVDVERKLKKINAAYALDGGVDGLKQEISMTFGIPIDYYLRVSVRGFVRLVNAVDGIDFYVPCYMDYDDPYQDLSIHYNKGTQHLNGQQALEVCRFRQNNEESEYGAGYGDGGRQQTQRGVLKAVLKKVLANPGRIDEYIRIAQDNLDTDLSLSEMMWFGSKALAFDTENLNMMSMPCEWTNPYMYLDPDATLELVNEYLNPYTIDRTAEDLDIITRRAATGG